MLEKGTTDAYLKWLEKRLYENWIELARLQAATYILPEKPVGNEKMRKRENE